MQATPELKDLVFHFQRKSPTTWTIHLNGALWQHLANSLDDPEIDSLADWGPGGLYPDAIAQKMLSVLFDPDVPGYGRIAGWIASDSAYISAVVDQLLAHETRSQFSISDTDLLCLAPDHIEILSARDRPTWPTPGERLRFIEPRMAFHTDVYENAKTLLVPGQIYTLSHINCASSWTAIRLKETGKAKFSYHCFERL